jgi:hypothetical protein
MWRAVEKSGVAAGVAFVGVVATHVPAATATAVLGRAVGESRPGGVAGFARPAGPGGQTGANVARAGVACALAAIFLHFSRRGGRLPSVRAHMAHIRRESPPPAAAPHFVGCCQIVAGRAKLVPDDPGHADRAATLRGVRRDTCQ